VTPCPLPTTLCRHFAVAVRYHYRLPLHLRAAHHRAGALGRHHADGVGRSPVTPRGIASLKFFGKLFLINFAIGVATGIVQEFQFGMNWSEYSRFVGDVFGAPLAMEGLAPSSSNRPSSDCGSSAGAGCPGSCTWPASGSSRSRSTLRVLHHRGQLVHAASRRRPLQPETHRAELTSITALLRQ
jgi:hypothetical protein